jgi:hypothetical protein
VKPPEGIGLIGTITYDVIHSDSGGVYTGLGGILYQTAVCSALAKAVFLFTNIGEGMADRVEKAIRLWPSLRGEGIQPVPGPGNRVLLHYPEKGERREILESVVPPLDPDKVLQNLGQLRMLICVFNSGFDITLEDWRRIVDASSCPLWLDVHSLVLSRELNVPRTYISGISWENWAKGVTYLQANKTELASLMGQVGRELTEENIKQFGWRAFDLGLHGVFITLGRDGVWVLTPLRAQRIVSSHSGEVVDTTGCGDVFCAVTANELSEGIDPFSAAQAGVKLAAQATAVKGVEETFTLVSRVGRRL